MKFWVGVILCLAVIVAVSEAQRGNFRQNNNRNNNFNRNNFNRNFRQNNNRFRPVNNNNFRNNRQQQRPQQQQQQRSSTNQQFAFGLDTSDGRYSKFNGPVKGLPHGHGGGKYGAADCLLCPNGF